MRKHNSLQAALVTAFPGLDRDREKLGVFVDKGQIAARAGPADGNYHATETMRGFEYRYTVTIVLLDFSYDANKLMLAILNWLRINEPEKLQNHQKGNDCFSFITEALDDKKADIEITMDLTEAVDVAEDGTMTYRDEPKIDESWSDDVAMSPVDQILVNGEVLIDTAPDD